MASVYKLLNPIITINDDDKQSTKVWQWGIQRNKGWIYATIFFIGFSLLFLNQGKGAIIPLKMTRTLHIRTVTFQDGPFINRKSLTTHLACVLKPVATFYLSNYLK